MTALNMNDILTYQTIENNVAENSLFSPVASMPVNNTEPIVLTESSAVII